MLKKKGAGFKPKPKGPMPRRNVPGAPQPPSQAPEEQPSQPPAPALTPADTQEVASTAPVTQTSVPENSSSTPSTQVESTVQAPAAVAVEAPMPTPPPTAPSETIVDDAAPIATENAPQNNTIMEENVAVEAKTAEIPTANETDKASQPSTTVKAVPEESTTAEPAQEPTPVTTSETSSATPAEPSQPGAKVPKPVRARLPTARRGTRPPGAAPPSTSGPSAIPAAQPTPTEAQIASPVPAHVETVETATSSDDRVPEATMDEPQPTVEETGPTQTEVPPDAPARPKRAPRKRKSAADTANVDGDAAPVPKRARKKAAVNLANGEGTEETESSQAPARPRRGRAPTLRDASETQSGGEGSDAAIAEHHPHRKAAGRQRSPTPENAEEQQVDMRQVKMGDLVKDLKIGRKFSRHEELLERERRKKLEAKMRVAGLDLANPNENGVDGASAPGTPAPGSSGTATTSKNPSETAPMSTPALVSAAPQFQIIDGQIVVNQATLQFDRHAAAADAAGFMEEEEEDEFTHLTTQNSYRKKIQKPNFWSALDTEQFYDALRMFGTDFETIAKMFPGKNRRHLKLKFNREERNQPAMVNAALIGEKVEINLDEFKTRAGLELKPTQEILDEDKARGEAFEAEQRQVEEAAAAEEARKREALFSRGANKEGEEGVGKKKGRGKKAQTGGGGMW